MMSAVIKENEIFSSRNGVYKRLKMQRTKFSHQDRCLLGNK